MKRSAFDLCQVQKQGAEAANARDMAIQLEQYFAEIDAQHPPVSEEEATSALDEAMRHVRPGYTSVR